MHCPIQVSGLLGEKDETIRQLELKLRTASNQRERAEERCGEALEENAKVRSDLVTLAAQVLDSCQKYSRCQMCRTPAGCIHDVLLVPRIFFVFQNSTLFLGVNSFAYFTQIAVFFQGSIPPPSPPPHTFSDVANYDR